MRLPVAVACIALLALLGVAFDMVGPWLRSPGHAARDEARQAPARPQSSAVDGESCLRIATWNVRGHPEPSAGDADWFGRKLAEIDADVLFVQEIANNERAAEFLINHAPYTQLAFTDSDSAHDNAIFATDDVALDGLDVPVGFHHPPQIAYTARGGFDAVVVTLHLVWEPEEARRAEMRVLEPLVRTLLEIDPDVMLAGDFNLRPEQVRSLAARLGMTVLLGDNQLAAGTLHSGSTYDYFLFSPDLASEEACGAEVLVFDGLDLEVARRVSDHLPVLAYFSCDERFRDRPAIEHPTTHQSKRGDR